METRAHFVLIGTFTMSVFVGVFLFVLWLAKVEIDRDFADYNIIFESNVTGLSRGGDVRYNGIKVGEVTRLSLDPENPSRVFAYVRIDTTTPVSQDSVATFEFIGLTGVAYIALAGGGPQSKPLELKKGEDVPSIVATPSAIQSLFSGAPDVLTGANRVILQVQQALNEENQQRFANFLDNLETVSQAAAGRAEEIDAILVSGAAIAADLAEATSAINELSTNLSGLVDGEGRVLIEEATSAVRAYGTLADSANDVVIDNSASIRAFADGGLAEFGLFVGETRQLVRTLDRVLGRFESDPARYLSGNYAAEVEAE